MYKQFLSEKLVIMVVMNGCPATAESVFRSFFMCSTCFNRMTVGSHRISGNGWRTERRTGKAILSVLRSIFSANTF